MTKITSYNTVNTVLNAIDDLPEKTASLQTRAELMQKIVEVIKKNRWEPAEAAKHCSITQPRMNDLLRGHLSNFSFDALINIAAAIGQRVHVELKTQ